MSGSLNRVTLIGNLGTDPETRSFQNGGKIVTFSLATSERWKDRNSGEMREQTEWHRIAILSPGLADIAERYLKKGAKVLVEGKLRTSKWQDQNGQDRYTTEIAVTPYNGLLTFLDGKRNENGNGAAKGAGPGSRPGRASDADLDEEVPF
jgi:single-strand DNA-binding protein